MAAKSKAAGAAGSVTAAPAIAERGEISLMLGGTEMVLRPSFEAITAFEAGTGKGLTELALGAVDARLTVTELAIVITECVRAWGRAVDSRSAASAQVRRVAELVLEAEGGIQVVSRVVAGVLAMATTGGYTAKGELKPATTKQAAPVAG